MRLFWTAACAEGGGDGRDVLQAPGGCVSFLTQLSFPVSNKHGKCAFGALGPAPAHPVALSSALQRGVTAHHGTADLLSTSSQRAFTPALSPFPCCSLCPFIMPFFPL